ncbi:MAG: DNA-binding protein [Bacteroides oleiciplenus]|jgi:predicted histone-like DNA-binding protein|uniref:HU family DNA-binding protein n=1 Tax=Bacteroides stercorirosoris TaxID=871324 RepID=UPI00095CF72E|nr:HU family DNA-binding protein [uncultured Bacteroides sp.]OKZ07330.1 MAG: DNA-binding protein [Bacteroides oleiciplenus]
MAEYEMQEMNLPNKEGKRVLYPRLVQRGQADTEYIARILSQKSSFSKGDVTGLLQELADELAYQMGQGKSVKLDGIGTFVPALTLRKDRERETGEEDSTRRNARSIAVGGINFRPEKSLVAYTNYHCELERSQQKFHRSSQKFTPEQRLQRAKQYLSEHPYMTVSDYCRLTGLRHTTASLELKKWAGQSETTITTSGRGTHKVYIDG